MREFRDHEAKLIAVVRKAFASRDGRLVITMPYSQALRIRTQLYALRRSIEADLGKPGNEFLGEIFREMDSVSFSLAKGADELVLVRKDTTAGMQAIAAALGDTPVVNPSEQVVEDAGKALLERLNREGTGKGKVIPLEGENTFYRRGD